MNKLSKKLAYKILRKYNIHNSRDYKCVQSVIEDNGFTVIPYKKHNYSKDLSECIACLQIEDEIEKNNSLFYKKNDFKLVFINSDLSSEDKYILLCHELGHVMDPTLQNSNSSCITIQNEEFANEFSYHFQNPSLLNRLTTPRIFKPLLLAICILVVLIIAGITLRTVSTYSNTLEAISTNSELYVTSNGKKYHRDFCIIIKNRTNLNLYNTIEDAKKDGYKPCLLCIGE